MEVAKILKSAGSIVTVAAMAISETLEKVAKDAYAKGYEEGKREAREEFKHKLAEMLAEEPKGLPLSRTTLIQGATEQVAPSRAPRGSVMPTILEALTGSFKGKKPSEIALETGLPENSVRGALNKLRKTNQVAKYGEVWTLGAPPVEGSYTNYKLPSQKGDQ